MIKKTNEQCEQKKNTLKKFASGGGGRKKSGRQNRVNCCRISNASFPRTTFPLRKSNYKNKKQQ